MNRIDRRFHALRQAGRAALVPYVTAGDPDPDFTVPLMHVMVEAGADLIELGVPFSDPMADGPVIQAACERALAHRVNLRQVLGMVARFRERDPATPVVLMGYLNPVEVMGYEAFAEQAARSGVDGVLTVDLPPEEGEALWAALEAKDVAPIFLLAPTSDDERVRRVAAQARGFLYYVSLKGVTGAAHLELATVKARLGALRRLTELPLGVGFGIRDADTAAQVARFADAVVVGSALVRRIQDNLGHREQTLAEITDLLRQMRRAMDEAKTAQRQEKTS